MDFVQIFVDILLGDRSMEKKQLSLFEHSRGAFEMTLSPAG